MAGRFAYSKPNRRGPNDPWFRIGRLDIGSGALLALLCIVSVFVYALESREKEILFKLSLLPREVRSGEIWRVATWPLANGLDRRMLSVLIGIAVLWYFGSRLEDQVGRTLMAWYLAMIIVLPGMVGTGLDLPQFGMYSVQLVVLLTFIAEYPNIRFFFGIPAWVLGAVYVAADVLQLTGDRAGKQLLFYLISLVIGALAARSVGLLGAYSWIPRVKMPHRDRQPRRRRSRSRPAVVSGPWGGTPAAATDHSELDALLDKISATGMDSLTKAEKQRLNELSKRLRGN